MLKVHHLSLAFGLMLIGCTTMDDFRKMSPNQRADYVCKNQREIRGLINQRDEYKSGISNTQSLLAKGYRLHKQCRDVTTYGDATTSCQTYGFGNSLSTTCNESRPKQTEQVCKETPVPINYEYEKGNLAQLQAGLRQTEENLYRKGSACMAYVQKLSADEAWSMHNRN